MDKTFQAKEQTVIKKFLVLPSMEERYAAIIEMGRELPPYPEEKKTQEHLVQGCQSIFYLDASLKEGKIVFSAFSDALISRGLAALLFSVYNKEPPETLLTYPPKFLTEIGILSQLSPTRSNGLAHMHARMKSLSLHLLKQKI